MPTLPIRRSAAPGLIGVAVAAFLAACSVFRGTDSNGQLQQLLNDSEGLWAKAALHNYVYDFRHDCDNCSGDSTVTVHVVVKNDVVSKVVRTSDSLPPDVAVSVYATVTQLFAITQSALGGKSSLVNGTFDTTDGHPGFIQIVPKTNSAAIGHVYQIVNFVAVTP